MTKPSKFARDELRRLYPDREFWDVEPDSDLEAKVRVAMRTVRKRLRQGHGNSSADRAGRRSRDRFARKKAKQLLKAVRSKPPYRLDAALLSNRFVPNTVLDALHPSRKTDWQPVVKRPRRNFVPAITAENFSFLDNPQGTLDFLKLLSVLEGSEIAANINFADEYVEDIGSFLVFAEVWPAIRSAGQGGHMALPVQKVLTEIGLGNEMKIRLRGAEASRDYGDIWTMPVERRRPLAMPRKIEDLIRPQPADAVAQKFGNLVNRWLRVDPIGAELTDIGRSKLKGIFGELLDNGVRHSIKGSRDGNWSMGAFMARRQVAGRDSPQFICRIAVLSLGQSIAESFDHAAPEIADYAESYAKKHENKSQSKSTLKTLLALQDMITTDPEAWERKDGGVGLMATLDFFNALASFDDIAIGPKLTIVSGNSCVMLRPPYMEGQVTSHWKKPGSPPRQQWCNANNTNQEPPDLTHVFDLNDRLAGTLITMGFTLDVEFINKALEANYGE